jgi:phosphoribosyl-AMP cyclohydrolase
MCPVCTLEAMRTQMPPTEPLLAKDFRGRMSESVMQKLKFDERGLLPAIVQDAETNEVLMLAWMNAESLTQTLATQETWFWSRSRQELWHKGATSGHTQRVVELRYDCDADALLVRVRPNGPACHTGEPSCFFRNLA